jgi:hypothetical protein
MTYTSAPAEEYPSKRFGERATAARSKANTPPDPSMCILSEPLHPPMGRLFLIKPESFCDKVVDGLLREGYLRKSNLFSTRPIADTR